MVSNAFEADSAPHSGHCCSELFVLLNYTGIAELPSAGGDGSCLSEITTNGTWGVPPTKHGPSLLISVHPIHISQLRAAAFKVNSLHAQG